MEKKVLVIAAHIGDFVWRSGGTIAKYTKAGAEVNLIVMTYGIRGECNAYWKKNPEGTVKECSDMRRKEGETAAEILGIKNVEIMDYEDYPMEITEERIQSLAGLVRKYAPDIILTHDNAIDPYNSDHTNIGDYVYRAVAIAAAAGAELDGLKAVKKPKVYGFEPHVPEDSSFVPEIYIDITDVQSIKEDAMKAYGSQKNMYSAYVNRARMRAQQMAKKDCRFAECFTIKHYISDQEFLIR